MKRITKLKPLALVLWHSMLRPRIFNVRKSLALLPLKSLRFFPFLNVCCSTSFNRITSRGQWGSWRRVLACRQLQPVTSRLRFRVSGLRV